MKPTAQTTAAIPPNFTIPDELQAEIGFLLEVYSTVAEELADKLFSVGLPEDQANTVAVDCLVRQSCELAMYTAIAVDKRPPSRERWMAVMGEVFDQTLAARAAAVAAFAEVRHG